MIHYKYLKLILDTFPEKMVAKQDATSDNYHILESGANWGEEKRFWLSSV